MDRTADDELTDELLELTRRLRGQLLRHATLGAWAAPGGASARIAAPCQGDAGDAEGDEPAEAAAVPPIEAPAPIDRDDMTPLPHDAPIDRDDMTPLPHDA